MFHPIQRLTISLWRGDRSLYEYYNLLTNGSEVARGSTRYVWNVPNFPKKNGVPLKNHQYFNGTFPDKPSILGHHHVWKPPHDIIRYYKDMFPECVAKGSRFTFWPFGGKDVLAWPCFWCPQCRLQQFARGRRGGNVYGGSHKNVSFSTCQTMCLCRFAWQAWHFVTLSFHVSQTACVCARPWWG